ncbi:MAG: hypothetical protein V4558_04980 [Gemmatimonadota bacterium]
MSRTHCIVAAALAFAAPLSAQGKLVNLTGRPIVALEEPFTSINGVRELPGNRAIVVDAGEKTVQMADFTRRTLTKISRNGSGPGEYQLPMAAYAGPDNNTYVSDPMVGKVHVVTADGKIPSTIFPPGGDGPGSLIVPRSIDSRGRLYYQGMGFIPGENRMSDTVPIVRWDPVAKRVDTLTYVPSGMVNTVNSSANRTSFTMRMNPYTRTDVWAALPDGRVAIVRPDPYRVDIVTGPGKVVKGVPIAYTPVKIGKAERDAFRKALTSSGGPMMVTRGTTSGGGGGAPSNTGPTVSRGTPGAIADEDFPAVMPAYSNQVRVSPEGEVWVPRNRPASDKVPTYDIFDSNGKLIGKATLKPGCVVVGFGAGTVYLSRQDPDDDLHYLEKYNR